MQFKDRIDVANQLIPLLGKYRGEDGVVLAVPRGGVPIGHLIAENLKFPLELIFTKKIGHPSNKEYAIGAISMESAVLNSNIDPNEPYILDEIIEIRKKLKEQYKKFMGSRKPINISGKTVIIVDDGIATGNTILATIKLIRKSHPKKIILCTAVAPAETAKKLEQEVDDFICLYTPSNFVSVGQFYENFEQVSDEEVISIIEGSPLYSK